MPAGILSRFIVKAHSFINKNKFWRYGVELIYENTLAVVEEDFIGKKVKITLKGTNKKGLLSAIRIILNEIHKDFSKKRSLNYYEMVPCNCIMCSKQESPHFFNYTDLLRYSNSSIPLVPCPVSITQVSVKELIDDVQLPAIDLELEDNGDLKKWLMVMLNNLRSEIFGKEGYRNFWRGIELNEPKTESEFQPAICNPLDHYCKVKGISLNREVKEGNGFVDVLFSYTNKLGKLLKVCLEIKKAHHQSITTGISNQLPIYMESAGTDQGIYMPVWFKNVDFNKPSKYLDLDHLKKAILKNKKGEGISIFSLDVTKPVSPSKRK